MAGRHSSLFVFFFSPFSERFISGKPKLSVKSALFQRVANLKGTPTLTPPNMDNHNVGIGDGKYIAVFDFGGQYAHLIVNRIRRLGAYAELLPVCSMEGFSFPHPEKVAGVVLSGGGGSVTKKKDGEGKEKEKEREVGSFVDKLNVDALLDLNVPILGLCLGHQFLASALGGVVDAVDEMSEYGPTEITIQDPQQGGPWIMEGKGREGGKNAKVWMSHGDSVTTLPNRFPFHIMASSKRCPIAAMACPTKKIYGFQFHPEVTHSENGMQMLQGFLDLCDTTPWNMNQYLSLIEAAIKKQVGNRKVFILVSGGVDSSVAFALLARSLGHENCYGLMVDQGLLRHQEGKLVSEAMAEIGFTNFHLEDASDMFLGRLKGEIDPEVKRKIIGQAFLDAKAEVAKRLHLDDEDWLLGQGTIYPDTIESGGTKHSSNIKTHHNRIEAFDAMIREGRLVEPLKDLYKDEVRALGRLLGLPDKLVDRHPFPGPGLGVRILCVNEPYVPDNFSTIEENVRSLLAPHPSLSGFSFVILPVRSVGVQGDNRSYNSSVCLVPPCAPSALSKEAWEALWKVAEALPNHVKDLNRVVLSLTHRADQIKNNPKPFVVTPGDCNSIRAQKLRNSDHTVFELIAEHGLYDKIWQFPVVLVPVGGKVGEEGIVLRPVDSTEAMTASAYRLPMSFLDQAAERLTAQDGIDSVFYDLTSKPPGTIEWE